MQAILSIFPQLACLLLLIDFANRQRSPYPYQSTEALLCASTLDVATVVPFVTSPTAKNECNASLVWIPSFLGIQCTRKRG